jgi:hypothetical protein
MTLMLLSGVPPDHFHRPSAAAPLVSSVLLLVAVVAEVTVTVSIGGSATLGQCSGAAAPGGSGI